MHSQPTAGELLAAVQQHLSEKILPTLTDPKLRFQTLVALHALSIVEREVAAGNAPLREEWDAIGELLGESAAPPNEVETLRQELRERNRRLAEEIRDGKWDDDPRIYRFLQRLVAMRLDASNPRFAREERVEAGVT